MTKEEKVGCYLRVSTADQDERNQRPDLEALCKARGWSPVWYEDHGLSGTSTERPAYLQMMQDARRGRIKAVVVWKFDRLGRTVLQLVSDLDALQGWKVDLVSARDNVDTTTTIGRAMFGIIAVFAQMERDGISERTKASYAAKKARAENLGQKVKWGRKETPVDSAVVQDVIDALEDGRPVTVSGVATVAGISRRQAQKAVDAAREVVNAQKAVEPEES